MVEHIEWQGRVKLVEGWQGSVPLWVKRIRAASQHPERATVRLSTIHKAKGLEWPHVVVLDDRVDLAAAGPDLPAEDQLLWYVAVTRATARLGVPDTAYAVLQSPVRRVGGGLGG